MLVRYSPEEIAIMLDGVESLTSVSELEHQLEGRTVVGISQKLIKLSSSDPNTWNPDNVNTVLASFYSSLWNRPKGKPEKVEESKQKIREYLRTHQGALIPDLIAAGLSYDFGVGYSKRISSARRDLGLPKPTSGRSSITRGRKKQVIEFLKDHPSASSLDLADEGLYYGILDVTLNDLRMEAGLVPKGYIIAPEAKKGLGISRAMISYLCRKELLVSVKIRGAVFVREKSISDYVDTIFEKALAK